MSFKMHVLDPFFCKPYSYFGQPGQLKKTSGLLLGFFQALLLPPLFLGRIVRTLKGPKSAKVMIMISTALVVSFIGLLLADFQFEGCWSLAVVTYLAFASIVS